MSFSGDLRAELAGMIPSGRRDRETSAAALLVNLCTLRDGQDGALEVLFSPGNLPALRKCFTLIQKTVNIRPDLLTHAISAEPQSREVILRDPGPELLELLGRTGFLDRDGKPRTQDGTVPPAMLNGTRCRVYLREMFLCTGFMNDPVQRYHLEFRCSTQAQADQLREVLGVQGVRAGVTRRRNYHVVYVKDSDDIVMLLHLMGASVSLMATENARIFKELRNTVNRRVNCETANISKTVESAGRQLEEISYLRDCGILQTLPAPLLEAAELREKHPGASLTELGELAIPPVGRSGMNHRMRKLSALARKAREERDQT